MGRTNEKTGTCGVCQRVFTASAAKGTLSKHGFQRPGDGWLHGHCPSSSQTAWEVSPEPTQRYAAALEQMIVREHDRSLALRRGEVRILTVWKHYKHTPTPYDLVCGVTDLYTWTLAVNNAAKAAEYQAERGTEELRGVRARLAAWKPGVLMDREEVVAPVMSWELSTYESGEARCVVRIGKRTIGTFDSNGKVYAARANRWRVEGARDRLRLWTAACACKALPPVKETLPPTIGEILGMVNR